MWEKLGKREISFVIEIIILYIFWNRMDASLFQGNEVNLLLLTSCCYNANVYFLRDWYS